MNAAVAMAWLPCPSPAYPADDPRDGPDQPDRARSPGCRLRRSTNLSTTNCATTITAVLAASAIPSVGRRDPGGLDAVRGQPRLELSVAGEEEHEAQHAQLHHGPVPEQRPPARRLAVGPRSARRPRCAGARGSRTVATTTASTRNIAASIDEQQGEAARPARRRRSARRSDRRRRAPGSAGRTAWRRPAYRVAGVEHHTIIVASAGCITACPAPSAAADSRTVGALGDSPRPSAPTAAATSGRRAARAAARAGR